MDYKNKIDLNNIPKHIAVIMDGNGRWAKSKGLPRIEGHKKGAFVVENLMDTALELKVKCVSLYAFSTENWNRPPAEVSALWKLFEQFFSEKVPILNDKGIKVVHSGIYNKLPKSTVEKIKHASELTKMNKNIILNFCVNYGSQLEIVDAVNEIIKKSRSGDISKVSISSFKKYLYQPELPDVDLLIRTSGEFRISNFLLWQCAYAEFVFMKVLWPDFKPRDLYKAIYEYQNRNRRFGGL